MIIPMLLRINLSEFKLVHRFWRGISITLLINWLVKPFSMAFLAWIFIKHWFSPWLPSEELDQYIAGLIILSAAPCTAMVFVWSYLCEGDLHFTLTQVTLNDLIMIIAFAPIVGLLLGITQIHVPWNTLVLSVLLYIVIPLFLAQLIRIITLNYLGANFLEKLQKNVHPFSLMALLLTLILLFSFQGEAILDQPVIVLLLALPILVQVYFNSMLAYGLNKIAKEQFCIAGPSALIGASNFFELAVATALALFGLNSGAALATVVGVLVEVPVMLSIVSIINRTERWYKNQ
jgi:ACR3 family arsenite transporter